MAGLRWGEMLKRVWEAVNQVKKKPRWRRGDQIDRSKRSRALIEG